MTFATQPNSKPRHSAARLAALAALAAAAVACGSGLHEFEGERSGSGECPPGEICSDETPDGLTFVGTGFWDDATLHVGPVLAGGSFDLGFKTTDPLSELPDFELEVDGPPGTSAEPGTGTFGPTTTYGSPLHPVDAFATVRPESSGEVTVRVVHAGTGELLDKIAFQVHELQDVTVKNMDHPEDDYLVAGEDSLLGVRLLVGESGLVTRAIDQDVTLSASGEVQPENLYWDCFTYTAPPGSGDVTFTVEAAGRVFTRTFPVKPAGSVRR